LVLEVLARVRVDRQVQRSVRRELAATTPITQVSTGKTQVTLSLTGARFSVHGTSSQKRPGMTVYRLAPTAVSTKIGKATVRAIRIHPPSVISCGCKTTDIITHWLTVNELPNFKCEIKDPHHHHVRLLNGMRNRINHDKK